MTNLHNIDTARDTIGAASVPAEVKERAFAMLDMLAASDIYSADGWDETETVTFNGNANSIVGIVGAILQGTPRHSAIASHAHMDRAGRIYDLLAG